MEGSPSNAPKDMTRTRHHRGQSDSLYELYERPDIELMKQAARVYIEAAMRDLARKIDESLNQRWP